MTSAARKLEEVPPPSTIYFPEWILNSVTPLVRGEIEKLPPQKKEEFLCEFRRKYKTMVRAYLLWLVSLHYAYVGQWGLQVIYWFTAGGLGTWMVASIFLIPATVRNFNQDLAAEILRNLKAIGGA